MNHQSKKVLPGRIIGILGGGQLGRMMTTAAKHMGYRVHVLSPTPKSPTGQVADLEVMANFDDLDAIAAFAKQVDVLTVETENIPVRTLEVAAESTFAYPGPLALQVAQNRGLEKQFMADNDIPTCRFRLVKSLEELQDACQELMPSVLKTTVGGYDGKGQVVIRSEADVEAAWNDLNVSEAILEAWVDYDFEFSVIGCRSASGMFFAYDSIQNDHENQILDVSFSPSQLPDDVNLRATKVASVIMERLDAVGVLAVEFFYKDGEIYVNEIAPRPHNSGHLTIEGHFTSQFEQHVRAICDLPLGSTRQAKPVAMANLLGDLWEDSEPDWDLGLSMSLVKLHLYGKEVPKPGRKMGHMIALAETVEQAKEIVTAARESLTTPGAPLDDEPRIISINSGNSKG